MQLLAQVQPEHEAGSRARTAVSGSPAPRPGRPPAPCPYGASGTPGRGGASGTPGRGGASGTRFIANRVLPPILRWRARLTSGSLVRTAVTGSMVVSTHRMHGRQHPELDLADPDPSPAVLGERLRPRARPGSAGTGSSARDRPPARGPSAIQAFSWARDSSVASSNGNPSANDTTSALVGHLRVDRAVGVGHPGRPGAAVARWSGRTSRRRSRRPPWPGAGRPRSSRPPGVRTPAGRRPDRRPG